MKKVIRKKIVFLMLTNFLHLMAQRPLNFIALSHPHAVELPSTQRFALMSDLVAALEQKAAPIFISPSLWNNFISRRNRYDPEKVLSSFLIIDLAKRFGQELIGQSWPNINIESFVSKIQKIYKEHYDLYNELIDLLNNLHNNNQLFQPSILKTVLKDEAANRIFEKFDTTKRNISRQLAQGHELRHEIDLDFICYKTMFNEQEWIIKKVADYLIVLVPKEYNEALWNNTPLNSFKLMGFTKKPEKNALSIFENQGKVSGKLTAQELVLGIKIDHLNDFFNPLTPQNKDWKASQARQDHGLHDVLITKKDLKLIQKVEKKPEQKQPENLEYEQLLHPLFIYLSGHGAIEKITFLEEKEGQLKKLLRELEYHEQQELEFKTKKEATDIFKNYDLWRNYSNSQWDAEKKAKGVMQEIQDIKQIIEERLKKPEELHGYIAGLARDEFIELLYFLEVMVNTKFFFYDTCFGGGKLLENAYRLINEYGPDKKITQISSSFNFTIVCGALADASTSVMIPNTGTPPFRDKDDPHLIPILEKDGKISIKLSMQQKFIEFYNDLNDYFGLEQVKGRKDEKLGEIINKIHNFKIFGRVKFASVIYNIPQVRFPHTEWFRVVDVGQYVTRLTAFSLNLLKTKNKSSLVLNNKQLALLYPTSIPLALEIKLQFPAFVSMKGGSAQHIIKELNAETFNFSEIIQSFFLVDYEYSKIFAIQSVTSKFDVTPFAKDRATIKNVVFVYKSRNLVGHENLLRNAIYFEDGNLLYAAHWSAAFDKKIPLTKNNLPSFKLLHEYDPEEKQKIEQFRSFTQTIAVQPEPESGVIEKALGEYELSDVAQVLSRSEARVIIVKYVKFVSDIEKTIPGVAQQEKIREFENWKNGLNQQEKKVLKIIEKPKPNLQELSDIFNNLSKKLKKLHDMLKA